MYLGEIPCQVSRSSPIFLIFLKLYSTIATESAYKVSSCCLGRLKCYDLVGWIWVELTEISSQVSRSSPSIFFFSLHSDIATKSIFEVSIPSPRWLECYDLVGQIW